MELFNISILTQGNLKYAHTTNTQYYLLCFVKNVSCEIHQQTGLAIKLTFFSKQFKSASF